MSEQTCSACEQLGQTPTPEHLAGVARFEARQQSVRKVVSLTAENARLRERVAALEGAVSEAHEAIGDLYDADGVMHEVLALSPWRGSIYVANTVLRNALTQADETDGAAS